MTPETTERPANSYRIALTTESFESRMDNVLLNAIRDQEENAALRLVSRTALKKLFTDKKIQIKGQRAKSNSSLAKGTTYVDIIGF